MLQSGSPFINGVVFLWDSFSILGPNKCSSHKYHSCRSLWHKNGYMVALCRSFLTRWLPHFHNKSQAEGKYCDNGDMSYISRECAVWVCSLLCVRALTVEECIIHDSGNVTEMLSLAMKNKASRHQKEVLFHGLDWHDKKF